MILSPSQDVALYSEERRLTFAELVDEMQGFVGTLRLKCPLERPLIALRVDNSVNAIVACLACWQNGFPFVLLDQSAQWQDLIEQYQVNLVCLATADSVTFTAYSQRTHCLNPDLRMLLSTSGTTGRAKLVMLSDNNLTSNARSIAEYLQITPQERGLLSLPLAYSYGFSIVSSHLLAGASVILADPNLMGKALWRAANTFKASSFAGVPFSYQFLLRVGLARGLPGTIKTLTQAGGKLAATEVAKIAMYAKEHALSFYVMYGQTEASPRIAYLEPEDVVEHASSIGNAIPGGELWLEDELGVTLTEDMQSGELVYRGPNVMLGYASEVDDLAKSSGTNVLHTGDLAYQKDGRYYITGRLKRMIKLNGKRFSLDDLQSQLSSRLDCAELVCTGEDDALCVTVGDKAYVKRAKSILADYGVSPALVRVNVVSPIPMTANGKFDLVAVQELVDAN
ncbi:AMP-binding protein [Aliagarivorans marinus]|uniref:AMP-binding protein n=1 Tax=Aliagarivorans marinus TaxID=561965 RepID=UPI000405B458|nr:AMP-binding protein [Aliagarivorans marinus]